MTIFMSVNDHRCAQKLTDASLIYRTVPKTKTSKMGQMLFLTPSQQCQSTEGSQSTEDAKNAKLRQNYKESIKLGQTADLM